MKQDIFAKIYKECGWGKGDFRSGSGENLAEVEWIVSLLVLVFDKYKWETLVDIGCGNFTWARNLLPLLRAELYTGVDIVEEIIDENRSKYKYKDVVFKVMDMMTDKLPLADVAIVKDVLPHLSYYYIEKAMKNICSVGYKHIILTGYLNNTNRDIETGDWREINLMKSPFDLPRPLEVMWQNRVKALFLYDNKILSKRFL